MEAGGGAHDDLQTNLFKKKTNGVSNRRCGLHMFVFLDQFSAKHVLAVLRTANTSVE